MSDRRMRGLEADTSTIDAYNAEHKKYVYDTDKGHNVYRVGAVTPSYPAGGELIHFVMTKNDTSQIDPALRYATISPVGNIAISGDITVSTTKHIGISAGAARVSYPSSGVVSVMDADFGIGTETPSEQFVLYKAGGGNALEIQSTATTTRLSQNRLELDRNNSEGSSDIQMSNNAAQIYYDDSALYLGTNIDKPVRIQQNNISIVEFPSAGNIKVLGNGSSTLTLEETGSTNVASISFNGTSLSIRSGGADKIKIDNAGRTTIYNNLLIQESSYVSNYHNTLAGSVGDTRLKQYGGGNVIVGLEPEFGGHNDIQLTVYGPMEAYTLLSNVLTLTPGSTPSVPVEGMIYVDYWEDALKIYYNGAWKIIASL